jgi:hypothetical protein
LHTLDFDHFEQCKDSHGKGSPRKKGYFPIQMRRNHRIARILHHPTFSFQLVENPA